MYGLVVSNVHADPAHNFFSFNAPIGDAALAGPHGRNELSRYAKGALMSLDPRVLQDLTEARRREDWSAVAGIIDWLQSGT
jgi:hypothetical protein